MMKKVVGVLFLVLFLLTGCTQEITGEVVNLQTDCSPNQRQFTNEPYYTGPLIETHLHMPVSNSIVSSTAIQSGLEDLPYVGNIPLEKISCLLDKEGITKAFAFFLSTSSTSSQDLQLVKTAVKDHPGKFVPFYMVVPPFKSILPGTEAVKSTMADNHGLYHGMGELRFDYKLPGIEDALPDDDYFMEMYRIADENNLIVQMHPRKGQLAALESVLEKYPDVLFLVHVMPDLRSKIVDLMEAHDNLYYSLDAEMTGLFGYQTIQNNQGPTKEEFLTFTRDNFDKLLNEALDDWKDKIEAQPDRFTWGTDKWFTWHFDEDVGALLEEFGRSFIGQLDPAVQERFAYQNAERMLRER